MRRKLKKGPKSRDMELQAAWREKEQKRPAEAGFRLEIRGQEGFCQQACPLLQSLKGHLSPVVTETQFLSKSFIPKKKLIFRENYIFHTLTALYHLFYSF